ncbi:Phosphoserine aminotransferase [Perkinsus olseni]|uniref:phosphoserine transaminase n=1 Tax=Perkinsus olseni TaxID=32597 RepID=A0A7J6M693_PEROL|nr:Phosphoserine aminotransferase [Perkinsus olseni]KAF4666985.1 Phosphoserine aminotransferase [Perkinsus olseni]KAF4677991.1 Phosphoserine aminotransferase [Perkinsus olseni]
MPSAQFPRKYDRVYNFSAGPCCFPDEVLEQARDEMLNWHGCGMSVMEMSHRGKEYTSIIEAAEADLREILNIPDNFKVIFYQGGATLQFAGIPFNMMGEGKKADYIVTGQWSEKAAKEAAKYGDVNIVANTKPEKFTRVPRMSEYKDKLSSDASYVYYCMNETVNGVEFDYVPDVGDKPLVCDMSSNFMSRPIDFSKYAVVYAGAQKNLGPAGVTVVIVDEKYLGNEMPMTPAYLNWATMAKAGSMYNTPACYAIYMTGLYLKYTKAHGGLKHWDDLAEKKSGLLYKAIEDSNGFYNAPVEKNVRSRMNVPFVIKDNDDDLKKKFLAEAKEVGLVTLSGHRSVGGLRASLYNGMPLEGVQHLVDFMQKFYNENQ